jgi:hypothetical protein
MCMGVNLPAGGKRGTGQKIIGVSHGYLRPILRA